MYARIVAACVLIFIGVAFIADAAGFGLGTQFWRLWPLFVIGAGAAQLLGRPKSLAGPIITTLLGVIFLVASLNLLGDNSWSYIWPFILIAVGLGILASLFDMRGARRNPSIASSEVGDRAPAPVASPAPTSLAASSTEDRVSGWSLFGGITLRNASPTFAGGAVTALFGSYELDLSAAQLAGPATVDASAFFGTTRIVMPPGATLELKGSPIFGSITDHRFQSHPPPGAPILTIRATSLFASIEIHD